MRETINFNRYDYSKRPYDFYATPKEEVINILMRERLYGTILDNSCGEGNISD